jgi:hypothetical protein
VGTWRPVGPKLGGELDEAAADDARDLHLREPYDCPDFGLRELVLKAQAQDRALDWEERLEEMAKGERGLDFSEAGILAREAGERTFLVLAAWLVERDGKMRRGGGAGFEDAFGAGVAGGPRVRAP